MDLTFGIICRQMLVNSDETKWPEGSSDDLQLRRDLGLSDDVTLEIPPTVALEQLDEEENKDGIDHIMGICGEESTEKGKEWRGKLQKHVDATTTIGMNWKVMKSHLTPWKIYCGACFKELAKPQWCAKCQIASYCSKHCQRKAWKVHKELCTPCTYKRDPKETDLFEEIKKYIALGKGKTHLTMMVDGKQIHTHLRWKTTAVYAVQEKI
jgi:hypothetical protein